MDKTYHPPSIETRVNTLWQQIIPSAQRLNGKSYSLLLPPPNITGRLHMGHGLQQTLMDILIRHRKMQGDHTLWQPGVDHAGIATQMIIERQLATRHMNRLDMGREAFVQEIWRWKEKSGSKITEQMLRLGACMDWQKERFSLDEGFSLAVKHAFITLYKEGLIYRGQRLVNWDTQLKTAISDLEVVNKPQAGSLWYIRYLLAQDTHDYLVIATTRPETLLGDSAVAVHPNDMRYQHLIGQKVQLPLCQRTIPIIADESVDPKFGSGCVKITPAHDFNDYATGQRHQLPLINIMTSDGRINNAAPKAYQGLERFSARKKIIEDLKTLNLIESIQPHTLQIPYGDRSETIIEPLLTKQWFIRMSPLAKPAISALERGELNFIPKNWGNTYLHWLEHIEDWCISRQLWWGHRIPAWYDPSDHIYVGESEADIRAQYQIDRKIPLAQDEDVLDTWFSAALWPFATLGWPKKTKELALFYPSQVLVTGFDIIFFWVARMVMMGLKLMGSVPFKEVYIHGLIRDHQGQKMSKSKGNVLDPLDVIDGISKERLLKKRTQDLMQPQKAQSIAEQTRQTFPKGIKAYGADAIRFTFCALANTSRDIHFDLKRIEGYRNFCNKLWNAARFVLQNTEKSAHTLNASKGKKSLANRWILSSLQHTIKAIDHHMRHYRFDQLAQTIYEFVWNQYCDWYLECAKIVLYNDNERLEQKQNTRATLVHVLEQILRLAHPIIPYITEEIWQQLKAHFPTPHKSILLASYPEADLNLIDQPAQENMHWVQQVVTAIRHIRSEMAIPPTKKLPVMLSKGVQEDQENSQNYGNLLKSLSGIETLAWCKAGSEPPSSLTTLVDQLVIHLPFSGWIDKKAEIKRLDKAIGKLNQAITQSEHKLNNPHYREKAPPNIVQKEQHKLTTNKLTLQKLQEQYKKIKNL